MSSELLASGIWPRLSGWPGSTSSLPVDSTTTRGRGRTTTRSRPTAASRPSWVAPRCVPADEHLRAGRGVLTGDPHAAPSAVGVRIATWAMPPSVSSSGTTALAPGGIGAPVMIRTHRPGWTV